MSQQNTEDLIVSGDYNVRHAASIQYFQERLEYAESELKKMLLIQNPNEKEIKRIAKLKEIQKNTKHNLEITILYSQTQRPYGL